MFEFVAELPVWLAPLIGVIAAVMVWRAIRKSTRAIPQDSQPEAGWAITTHDLDMFGRTESKKAIIDKSRKLALYDIHRHGHPDQGPYCLFCFAEGENFYPVFCDKWTSLKEDVDGQTRQIALWVVTGDLQDIHVPSVWPEHFLPIADIPNDTERRRIGALVREALCFRALSKLGPDDLPDIVWAAELDGVRSYITDYV